MEERTQKLAEIEEANRLANSHIKALELELNTARQDIATLMKVSEDFQQKFDMLTDKEAELNEKNKEYILKIQDLNLEKDRCSLGERKLQREIEKLTDEHREETRIQAERYEKMIKVTKKSFEDKITEKDEESYRLKTENEELHERCKILEEQLSEANKRMDQLYKIEADRRSFS